MKFPIYQVSSSLGNRRRSQQAFTLIEMTTTAGIFVVLMLAFISSEIFGLRQDELVESKLGASDQSRKGFDQIVRDVRAAKVWQIGNYAGSTFTPIASGTSQQGSGLQLSFTNNYATNVVYYFTTSGGDNQLWRYHTGDATYSVIASNLNGGLIFSAEDYKGMVVTDLQFRYVIHFILQFQQYQYPLTMVGTNYLYNLYRLEFRVTPHCPD